MSRRGSERVFLVAHGRAAVDGDGVDAGGAAETLALGVDLEGELAGGREDEGGGGRDGSRGRGAAKRHAVEHGEEERERLARARLGDGDGVAAGARHGPRALLDGGGRVETRGV